MDSKGVSRLQASGTMIPATGGADGGQRQVQSVREKAQLYETRRRLQSAGGADANQGGVGTLSDNAHVAWPPLRPGGDTGPPTSARALSREEGTEEARVLSVREIQRSFEGPYDNGNRGNEAINVGRSKDATSKSGPASATTLVLPGNSAAYCDGHISSSGRPINMVSPGYGGGVRYGQSPQRIGGEPTVVVSVREIIRRLDAAGTSDNAGGYRVGSVGPTWQSQGADSEDEAQEEMVGDMELTWRNDVLASNICQVLSSVMSPPHFFYQEPSEGFTSEAEMTREACATSQCDAPCDGVAVPSSVNQVLIPAGDVAVSAATPSLTSRSRERRDFLECGGEESVLVDSECALSKDILEVGSHNLEIGHDVNILNQVAEGSVTSSLENYRKDDVTCMPWAAPEVRRGDTWTEDSGSEHRSPTFNGAPAFFSSPQTTPLCGPHEAIMSGDTSMCNNIAKSSLQLSPGFERMTDVSDEGWQHEIIGLPRPESLLQGTEPAPREKPDVKTSTPTTGSSQETSAALEGCGCSGNIPAESACSGSTFPDVDSDVGGGFSPGDATASGTMHDTFLINPGIHPDKTFSRIKSGGGSYTDSSSCSGDEDELPEHLVSDGEEDEDEGDIRRIQQRYGEILQWSDMEALERSLKMSLTLDIKENLSTMTEVDFAAMMSEYRDGMKEAREAKEGTHRQPGQGWGEASSAGRDHPTPHTVMLSSERKELQPSVQTGDSGLGDTGCEIIMATSSRVLMNGGVHEVPLRGDVSQQLLAEPITEGQTRDASTSMGEATLRASMGTFSTMTSECSRCMHGMTSPTRSAAVTPQGESQGRICQSEATDDDTGDDDSGDDDSGDEIVKEYRKNLLRKEDHLTAQFSIISQDLDASDRELVKSSAGGRLAAAQWEQLLIGHLQNTEELRKCKQADAYRNNQRLKAKLTQHQQKSRKLIEPCEERANSIASSPERKSPIEIQLEEQMMNLRDSLMTSVKASAQASFTREDQLTTLTKYRTQQRELIKQFLSEKRHTEGTLHEQSTTKQQFEEVQQLQGHLPALQIQDKVREMDQAFYGDLCAQQKIAPIPDEELELLISAHVNNVDSFRRKLETEVSQKRYEAIQKRLACAEENSQCKAWNANFATELVLKERETADLLRKHQELQRAKYNQKLQAKLVGRKKQREQKQQEEHNTNT